MNIKTEEKKQNVEKNEIPEPEHVRVVLPTATTKKKETTRSKNRKKQFRGQANFTAKWDRDCPNYV